MGRDTGAALIDAISAGDLTAAGGLLEAADRVGSPLPLAAREVGPSRQFPILIAIGNGDAQMTDLLIRHGADPRRLGDGAPIPLHLATRLGSTEVVEVLLRHGVSPNTTDKSGRTPLMCAVIQSSLTSLNDDLRMVDFLVGKGADLNRQNERGDTALAFAVKDRSYAPEILEAIIRHGADPNTCDRDGLTPLHWAVHTESARCVELLLIAGAKPDAANGNGDTPLHLAARANRQGLVTQLLIEGGATDATNRSGERCFDVACKNYLGVGPLLAMMAAKGMSPFDPINGRTLLQLFQHRPILKDQIKAAQRDWKAKKLNQDLQDEFADLDPEAKPIGAATKKRGLSPL